MKRGREIADALRSRRGTAQESSDCPPEARWVELLQGGLDDLEAARLRAHLEDCAACAATARDARRFLEAFGPGVRRTRWPLAGRLLAVAAALVLAAIGLGLFLVRAERAADAPLERLIAGLEVALPESSAPGAVGSELVYRGDGDELRDGRAQALQAYRERHWEAACAALDRVDWAQPDERELRFLAAVACLKAGELDRADGLLASLSAVEGDRREAARELLGELRRARGRSER